MSTHDRENGMRGRRGAWRSVVAGLGTATVAMLLATPAAAAQPKHQGCLGDDIRMYATGGVSFGTFVAGTAAATDGVGAEIQAHLAGAIPDAVQPNSCND